jgi:hypothetical protein
VTKCLREIRLQISANKISDQAGSTKTTDISIGSQRLLKALGCIDVEQKVVCTQNKPCEPGGVESIQCVRWLVWWGADWPFDFRGPRYGLPNVMPSIADFRLLWVQVFQFPKLYHFKYLEIYYSLWKNIFPTNIPTITSLAFYQKSR